MRPQPRIAVAPYHFADAWRLQRELGIAHPLAQILVRRGLTDPAEARAWMAADARHDASAFGGLTTAAAHLLSRIRDRARITVHGDYDVDGVCSTAVLVSVLRRLGGDVDWFLPHRVDDGYGLASATVARLVARGTTCLVCVDCAITAVDEVAQARLAGLDVVVCDHHAPRRDGVLPDAVIVHPALGDYPCPELCATGVAHKLAGALLSAAGERAEDADADLDLVALATVCDVVPLRDENRRLVREGLRALARTDKPGLRALMRVVRVDPGELNAGALGFRLGPRLNAAGRVARADAALELVLTEDPERAGRVADELDALNVERRMIETRILFAAEAQIASAGVRPAHVVAGEDWHRGVVGIVAGRLAERHHRPVAAIAVDGKRGVGSARSIPGYDLLGGLEAAAGVLTRYGGHRAAAGFEIERDRIDAFRETLVSHAQSVLRPEQLVPEVRVDGVACGDELGLALAEELEALQPFGAGNPAPRLLVPGATLSEPMAMGEGRHARLTLEAGGLRSRVVCFGQGARPAAPAGVPVDAVVALERHRWGGVEEARLVLNAAARCEPPPVEVLGEPRDYLAAAVAARDAAVASEPAPLPTGSPGPSRVVCDRRGHGLAGILGDLVASGESVLVLAADAQWRADALAGRVGGFSLASHAALEHQPELATPFTHLVALDPPAIADEDARMRSGHAGSFCHLAWGEAELRLSRHVLYREYDLRAPLAALYRGLRGEGRVGGARLEALLRGAQPARPPSPARGGRLLAVLEELDLATTADGNVALSPTPGHRDLQASATFRASQARLREGLGWLSEPTAQAA